MMKSFGFLGSHSYGTTQNLRVKVFNCSTQNKTYPVLGQHLNTASTTAPVTLEESLLSVVTISPEVMISKHGDGPGFSSVWSQILDDTPVMSCVRHLFNTSTVGFLI